MAEDPAGVVRCRETTCPRCGGVATLMLIEMLGGRDHVGKLHCTKEFACGYHGEVVLDNESRKAMPEFGRRGNMVARRVVDKDHNPTGEVMWWFWCPGCKEAHAYSIPRWARSGTDDAPTFMPSLLCTGTKRCHLFLRAGVLDFLSDCEHPLAGQKVPLPEPPDWLTDA